MDKLKTYYKTFVIYSHDKNFSVYHLNKLIKDYKLEARELEEDETIYKY